MLLIDTGAEASIIKSSVIKNPFKINTNERRDFLGAFGGCTKTLGQLSLQLNNQHDCIFNVVNNLNNTHIDGILGTDFLRKIAVIDFVKNKLILNSNNKNKIAKFNSVTNETIFPNYSKSQLEPTKNHKKPTHNKKITSENIDKTCKLNQNKNQEKPKVEIKTQKFTKPQIKNITTTDYIDETCKLNQKKNQEKPKIETKIQKLAKNQIKNIELSSTITAAINQIMQIDISDNFKCKQKNQQKPIKSSIKKVNIPAQCSKVIEISIPAKGTFICDKEEMEPGVFVANSICTTDSHNSFVRSAIINTTTVEQSFKIQRLKRQFRKIDTEDIQYESFNKIFNLNSIHNISLSQSREDKILSVLDTDDLGSQELKFVKDVVHNFSDLFFMDGDSLGFTNIIEHSIDLEPGKGPIHAQPYKIPHSYKPEVKRQIEEMLSQKIIQPSISPYNAPIVVVKKKGLDSSGNPKLRICLDFRRLNDVTISDAYPLPNINEFLMDLQGANYISIIDLAKGFHQIKMKEEDAHKTAFSFDYGHYEFIRMPFGLKNSPATFQRGLDRALLNTQGLNAFCYIDDAIIISEDLETHRIKLEEVLYKFRKHNLKLQTEKCKFLKKEVTYVGHQISKNGIAPDPIRYESVKNFIIPKTVRNVKQFLGLCNQYRKFIENYAMITGPLNDLVKGAENIGKSNKKVEWNEEADLAFKTLKNKLSTSPVLRFPDYSKSFKLETDASLSAIGGILSNDGSEGAIQYMSRTLNPAERNYSTTERELLAIIFCLQQARHMILGYKVKIVTDHKALTYIMNIKETNSRLIRWKLTLAEYDHEIVFKPGKEHTGPDALSRLEVGDEKSNTNKVNVITRSGKIAEPSTTFKKKSHNNQKFNNCSDDINNNTHLSNTNESVMPDINNMDVEKLLESDIIVITDPNQIDELIKIYHDTPLGGHQGVTRTYKRLHRLYRWNNMLTDIENYIQKCTKCQKNKTVRYTKMPMVITDTAQKPFEKVYLDIVGPLPISNSGNKYLLTFEDNLTKFMDCYPMPNQEANTVARIFYDEIISRYRIPDILLTDQGANFTSEMFKKVCKLLKIKKIQTTAYRPQSNGALERAHRSLVEYLKCFVGDKPQDWDTWLRQAVHVHNNYPHTSTKLTPMDCLFGFTAELPSTLKGKVDPTYNFEDYFFELRQKLQTTYQFARKNIIKTKTDRKKHYDQYTNPAVFTIGQKVLLFNQTKGNKFSENWLGPFEVISVNNNVNTTIKIRNKLKRVHNNKLKPFKE